jgi:hypothetical protein
MRSLLLPLCCCGASLRLLTSAKAGWETIIAGRVAAVMATFLATSETETLATTARSKRFRGQIEALRGWKGRWGLHEATHRERWQRGPRELRQ